METITFKKQLLVFLVVSALAQARSMRLSRWEIHIKNDLSKEQKLFVHCKSKDTDLGERTLIAGAEFIWKLRVNIWGTTLFWCYLHQPDGHETTFDAFWVEKKTKWLRVKCDNSICNWIAKDAGIYLKDNSENTEERIHSWKLKSN